MFDRSAILNTAWANYRRDAFKGWGVRRGEPFNRQHFGYCLRQAWAVAKELAANAAAPIKSPPVAKVCADPVRAEAIRTEMHDMELASDFINWTQHGALGAELAHLHA
jgi:hypothetical protein